MQEVVIRVNTFDQKYILTFVKLLNLINWKEPNYFETDRKNIYGRKL